jgi:hypothetical protein
MMVMILMINRRLLRPPHATEEKEKIGLVASNEEVDGVFL